MLARRVWRQHGALEYRELDEQAAVVSARGVLAESQWKAHLLEEGGIARITLEPLEVGLAFYL